jgi:hypothetical protein
LSSGILLLEWLPETRLGTKTVCKSFNCLPLRPAPSYKLAFLFPVESSKPELVHVDCRQKTSDESGLIFEMPEMSSLLGDDMPYGGTRIVTTHHGVLMDHTICIRFRDFFLGDGSKPNRSILACTRERWPILGMARLWP